MVIPRLGDNQVVQDSPSIKHLLSKTGWLLGIVFLRSISVIGALRLVEG